MWMCLYFAFITRAKVRILSTIWFTVMVSRSFVPTNITAPQQSLHKYRFPSRLSSTRSTICAPERALTTYSSLALSLLPRLSDMMTNFWKFNVYCLSRLKRRSLISVCKTPKLFSPRLSGPLPQKGWFVSSTITLFVVESRKSWYDLLAWAFLRSRYSIRFNFDLSQAQSLLIDFPMYIDSLGLAVRICLALLNSPCLMAFSYW